MNNYTDILNNWNITRVQDRSDLDIAGSPERSINRTVFEDSENSFYILEQLDPANVLRKTRIAKDINRLLTGGFRYATPYLPATGGTCVAQAHDNYWMLRPYIDGSPVNRETYCEDAWRGEALADVLIQLHTTQTGLEQPEPNEIFSLPDYIQAVLPKLETRQPGLTGELTPVLNFINQYLSPIYNELPTGFCHGDFHPLNVIWGDRRINTVIDWEFSGYKPEIYDLSLLLGCIGFDDPGNLSGPLCTTLIQQLKDSTCYQDISWKHLIALMTAIRIAWLREWIFRDEQDAIQQELLYMQILTIFYHQNSFCIS